MFAVPFLSDTLRRMGAARARHGTERLLHSLPLEVQKDIGWPEVDQRQPSIEVAARNSLGIVPRHG